MILAVHEIRNNPDLSEVNAVSCLVSTTLVKYSHYILSATGSEYCDQRFSEKT